MELFEIGWRWSSCQEVLEEYNKIEVLPSTSWDPQSGLFIANRQAGTLGGIFIKHKSTSTLTVFGLFHTGLRWIFTRSGRWLECQEWSTYQPSGNEGQTSEKVISDSGSRQIRCTSEIWTTSQNGRKFFTIVVNGMLPSKTPLETAFARQVVEDRQPRDPGN